MIWKHSSSLEQTWKLRTAAVGFCASKGTGIGATSMFDNCLSLLNHLAFLSKWNHMILGNNEVNTLKVDFCSASSRKKDGRTEWERTKIQSDKGQAFIPSVRWTNTRSMGCSALLKYVLFSKGLKLSVTHLDMSLCYNSNVGSGPLYSRNLCCFCLTMWIPLMVPMLG